MRLVFMGPPCVGKTSFKSLLFNWPAPKVHDSTALATRPIRAIERVAELNESKVWKEVTGTDLLTMLSDAIRAIEQMSEDGGDRMSPINSISESDDNLPYTHNEPEVPLLRSHTSTNDQECSSAVLHPVINQSTTNVAEGSNAQSVEISSISLHKSISSMEQQRPIVPNVPLYNGNASAPLVTAIANSSQYAKSLNNIDHYSKEMVEILSKRNMSQDLHKATWINILDSGGQPQFSDVSRAFIRGNTINVIFTKLTEQLADKPQFLYSVKGKLLNQPNELQMTNLQLIEHIVRSLVSSKKSVSDGNKPLPLFMIIGTYFDKTKVLIKKSLESLQKKNSQLLAVLHEFKDHLIFYNNDTKELIFPVDNLCKRNRTKISNFFRDRIMSCQKDIALTRPIPVRWYMFEMRLQEEASQEEHGMLSLEACCNIGANFSMNQSDVLKCITHLHSMMLFLYFPVVLPNIIFCNPQYLLEMLSTLISVSFVDSLENILLEAKPQSITTETHRKLREDGIFDYFLLDKIGFVFSSSLFQKNDFLSLLQYLQIIAPLSTTDTIKHYFMPVILPPCQASIEDVATFTETCDPMIISFEGKVVPQVRHYFSVLLQY